MAETRGPVRTLLWLSWPGLLLWGHLALRALLDRVPYDTLYSAWPLSVYAGSLGFIVFVLTAWSLLWLICVWYEDDKPRWTRLTSAGILAGGVVAVGVLRAWLD